MANNKIDLGCKQLKGTFQMNGKVVGRQSQNFYAEGTSNNGKAYRKIHFGVEIEQGKVVYVDLFGSAQDVCYISKRTTLPGGKTQNETTHVPWAQRFEYEKDPQYKGFQTIGVTCGCKKIIDSKGIERNEVKHLTAFDACDEIQNLHDDDSVFIRGNLVYRTYNDKHRIDFEPTQISLCKPIDFDDMAFVPNAKFTQPVVLMSVEANKETGEYDVLGKVVNYQTVEDAEYHIKPDRKGLAKTLKKLGSYVHIEIFGDICVEGEMQEETVSDEWGASNAMKKVASPFVRKLVVQGADPETIDKEAYSKAVIEHAEEVIASIQSAKNDYGEKDEDWGGKKSGSANNNFDDDELDDPDFDLGM